MNNLSIKLNLKVEFLMSFYKIAFIAAIRATPYTTIIIKRVFTENPFIKEALAS